MPNKLTSACRHPGCPNIALQGGYCDTHAAEAKQYDRWRGSAASRGYGAQWQRIREMILAREPLCRDCDARGKTTAATMVHHIDGNPRNNHPDNFAPLCPACHARVTAANPER